MEDLNDFRKFLQIYGLDAEDFIHDEAGETLATARFEGVLRSRNNIAGTIGGSDPIDVYSFTLDTPSQLIVDLADFDNNTEIDIIGDFNGNGAIDPDSERIASSISGNGVPEDFDLLLNPGTYFVSVRSRGGESDYELNLTPNAAAYPSTDGIQAVLVASNDQVQPAVLRNLDDIHLNSVSLWDEVMQEAVRKTGVGPTIASRAYGIVHTAMFDAWAAYNDPAVSTQTGNTLQRPPGENTLANKNEAVSYAAYRTLAELFPTQVALFNEAMTVLGFDPADVTTDTTDPAGIGNVSAETLMQFRRNDGSNQLGDYSDTTGYTPVNPPEIGDFSVIVDPDRWQPLYQPLRDTSGIVQQFLTPQWGQVIPFGLESGGQFRPGGPPLFGTEEYTRQYSEIVQASANLTDEQKVIAEFWEDGPGTSFPPGSWMGFGQFISERDNHSIDDDVKLFFALGNAVMDAGIAAWETKVFYDSARPITGIAAIFQDQPIQAWGGAGLGTQTIPGDQFVPYQAILSATPPFGEYVSGHSTFSAAAAEILLRETGSDVFGLSFTQTAGNNRFDAGTSPSQDVTLSWPTFSAAAEESGLSRIYGGIHIEAGDIDGRTLGRQVGGAVWDRAQQFINGTV